MSEHFDAVLGELTVTADTDVPVVVIASSMTTTFISGPLMGRKSAERVVLIETDEEPRTCPIVLTVDTARKVAAKLIAAADETEDAPLDVHLGALRVIPGGGEGR